MDDSGSRRFLSNIQTQENKLPWPLSSKFLVSKAKLSVILVRISVKNVNQILFGERYFAV